MFSVLGFTAILSWPFAAALAMILLFHDIVQPEWSVNLFRRLGTALLWAVLVVLSFLVRTFILSSQK